MKSITAIIVLNVFILSVSASSVNVCTFEGEVLSVPVVKNDNLVFQYKIENADRSEYHFEFCNSKSNEIHTVTLETPKTKIKDLHKGSVTYVSGLYSHGKIVGYAIQIDQQQVNKASKKTQNKKRAF